MSDQPKDPATIEHELEAARARLGTHLDELTSRLSPGQLLDEGLSYLRNGQGAEFVRNLGAQVRDNPLPVAIMGIGLTWLAVATGRSGAGARPRALLPYDSDRADWELRERARQAGEAITRNAEESDEAFRGRVAEARAGVMGLTRQAQETASAFADRVQQMLDSARDTARDQWDRASQSASDWRDSISARSQQAGSAMSDAMHRGRDYAGRAGDYASRAGDFMGRRSGELGSAVVENPVLLAAISVTAGALLGALLPGTRQEQAWFGAAAGDAADKARDLAREAARRGGQVAEAAANAGYEAARDAGREMMGAARPARESESEARRREASRPGEQPVEAPVINPADRPVVSGQAQPRRDLH